MSGCSRYDLRSAAASFMGWLTALLLLAWTAPAAAQVVLSMTIPPDGPEQMPVIYVHGWRDDGADWGLASESCIPGTPKPRKVSGAQFFTAAGMPNWAVQWWSSDGSPTSSHEDGWAFLSTGDELIRGSTWMESGSYAAQNHPCPDPIEVNLAEGNFFPKLKTMRNTYNDAGSVEDQARDLLELIRYERTAGRLQDWSQINLLTHSKGSLVVRAMLDMAAKESAHDVDYIANVIYNAPPFGGSALAPLASIVFSDSPEDLLGSPWFHAMIDSWIEEEVDTVGGVLERINRTFTDIGRGSAELLQERLPPGTLAGIAALKLPFFKLSAGREIAAFQDNRTVREVLKTLQDIITPVFRHWMYFPGEPALSDLHPERMHLTAYTTQAGVNQYMTYGSPLKGTVPFPCDFLTGGTKLPCVGDIASSPLLLTNASQYRFSRGDLVVPVGSARILADTDAFGPPIQVLAEIPAWHGDLIYDVDRMGDHWMRIFLAPQSFLSLSGEIVEVSAKERSYLVTGETSFSPEARSATARTAPWYQGLASVTRRRTAEAKRFEYRLAPAFGGATEPTPWVSLPLGGSVRFSELSDRIAAVAGSPESPFLLQWRSINEDGGREMVRSARFVVEPEVAQVVSMSLIGQGNEVVSPPRGILRADRAVRSSVLARIGDPLVSLLSASSEPRWVLRNPDTKALSLVLSHRGSISYAWDDESMANPFVVTDVGGTLIPLTRLPEGLHVLTYQTFNPFGSSPRQSLRILVDETPPVVTFQYQSDHGFGHVVGPDTPLRFEVHDVGTGAGEGELRIEGYGGAPFPSNTTFRLGETSIGRGNEGVEGLMLTMVANVRDRVGNQKEERFEVYYDWVPPSIEVVEVKGALATGPGSYRAFQPEVEVVVIARDGASGVAPPVATTVVRDRGTLSSPAFVPEGRPNHWIGRVPLAAGRSQVSIATRDLMDNAEQVEISVEYSQIEFEQEPIETLSYRLDVECFASSGNPIGCTQGTISSLSTSVSGDAVAFSSAGNRFVRDDLNNVEDVFLWRAGSIIRVSEGPNGEEADRASNMPAISGNGRYVFFRSSATNLIEGTTGWNVFVKDTFTGALGLVSRRSDGTPANIGVADFQQISATYSGRYVVFESRGNDLVEGLTDENVLRDIFLVDLDPDGDGDFFNGAYVTHGISVAGSKTGNGFSHWPEISQNGKYIVFMTEATDLHPLLADYDGRLSKQAVLVELGGSEESGDLDPSRLSFIPISTSEATGGKMLAEGVSSVRIAPFSDTVVFAARGNVAETGDVNNPATGQDLYISSRTTPGGPIASRTIRWASQARGPGGPQTGLSNAPFASIAVAAEPSLGPGEVKVAWVSEQDNIEAGDANGVADLFLRRSSPTYPANLPVINWISDGLSSSEPVIFADLSPDGRYAIWATTQSYEPPYGRTEVSLYRRRIEPVLDTTLAVQVQGEGNVVRSPPGREGPTGHLYLDEDRVSLQAVAGQGYRFLGWEGADTTTGSHATVEMHRDREVRAVFVPMSPPVLREPLLITTLEDTPSTGIRPEFTDPDPDDAHSFSIVAQPSNGRALIVDGLVVYVPDLDFNGADAFTFQITDSAGLSLQDPGQAQVVVEPVNDPPLSATVEIRVRQDGTSAPTPPVVVDPDDGDSFEVRVLIEPEHGLLGAGEGRFVYTAGPSFDGADQFVFQAIDSGGESVVGFGTVVWGGDDEGEGGTGGGVGGSGGAGGTDDGDGSGGEGRDGGAAPGAGAEQDAGCGCGSGAGRGGGLVQGGLWTILFLGAWVRRMSRRVLPLD